MSMEAVALVRISASALASRLRAAGPSGTALRGANDEPFELRALDDGCLIFTDASLRESDPDELGLLLRELLGDVIDSHDDDRGVLVFPRAALPKARTYADAVAEVAEMGEWIQPSTAEEAAAENTTDFAAVAGDLMSQLGPEMFDLQQRMSAGDPTAMQDAMAQVGALLADPAKASALMNAVSALAGGEGGLANLAANMPPGMAMPNPADLMKNMDVGALQQQAQQMMADNPELEQQLRDTLDKKKGS